MSTSYTTLKALHSAARVYLDQGATHLHLCKALKGPEGEEWTVESECDCGFRDLSRIMNLIPVPDGVHDGRPQT